jgi:putative membrane protein
MRTTHWPRSVPVAAMALTVVLAGCGGTRDHATNGETGSTGSMSSADTAAGAMSDTGSMSASGAALTDANIVALLDEANQADSASGALAASKGTSADVKAYGKLMMKDHHKLRAEGKQLAQKQKIQPAPPANDPVASMASKEKSALQSAQKGAEFDRTYIEQTISGHQAVLDLLDRSASSATDPQIKAMIQKARPEVQEHLTKAQAIQKKLSASA